jgi:hypothetical protein
MTESQAQAEAERKASERGCPPSCACPECLSDEIDVAAARAGLDVAAIQMAGRAARAAHRPSRQSTGSGNGSGARRPARRGGKPASFAQLTFIAALWADREFESPLAAQVAALETYEEGFDVGAASTFIDMLKKLPRRGARETRAAQARANVELEVGRFYKFAGEIYRIQRGRGLYAKRLLEDGRTEYAPGIVTQIDPSMKLSLEEARAWGRETRVCCECGAQLTDPNSVAAGIGPICAGRYA